LREDLIIKVHWLVEDAWALALVLSPEMKEATPFAHHSSYLRRLRAQNRGQRKMTGRMPINVKKTKEASLHSPQERLEAWGYRILSRRFYLRGPGEVARRLLGKYLVRQHLGELLIGRIVETEAYYGSNDPASHAFRGMTERNKLMFGIGGKAYIYLAYGSHYLLNIVTGTAGTPGAVLIRAVEPVEGIEEMARRRRTTDVHRLTNGPGRLTQAFGIGGELNGCDVTDSALLICRRIGERRPAVAAGHRIGISRGKQFDDRYYIPGNSFVSAKPNR